MSDYHRPVLLKETIEGLNIEESGVYVDVTFGGGGHSRQILKKLTNGRLLGFDQDHDAEKNADLIQAEFPKRSFTFIDSNFRYLKKFLRLHGAKMVDGILADLGVSSHQFNEGERGFSTRFDSDLDMRMNRDQELDASEILNTYDEQDLIHMFSMYGEIRNARTLARAILDSRNLKQIKTSGELRSIASSIAPRGKENKYLAQVFQALRIVVNDEMAALREFLEQCADVIKPGGRLVVISYHSLEDRLVKNSINKGNVNGKVEKDFYGNLIRPFEPVNRKLIIPSEEEIKENNRARSARLRIGQRNEWR